MARVTKSDIFRSPPLEFLCMMQMFVPGFHGGMRLMILNPGVSRNNESAASLYKHFFGLDVHQCNKSGYENQWNCRSITRTIMVAGITDRRLCI